MRAALHPHQGFWLDRQEGLTSSHLHALASVGLQVQPLSDWSDLPATGTGQWLALRIDSAQDVQELASQLSRLPSPWPVIARVPTAAMALAVAAMKAGACHVIAQDEWSVSAWREAFRPGTQTDERAQAPQEQTAAAASESGTTAHRPAPRSAIYVDPLSRHLLALAQRVGQAGVTALIEGPTGAGKEVLARVLHESSARAGGPFVALNCATLPEQLIDDMLFGHEKGAFTGAQGAHRGLFEQAQGGSIFLDEIGEMPLHLQAKLLRVLQERQLTRLGSERRIDLDVRVIAATNKDLRQAIVAREFREDLYFRISTFKLRIAPLRERPLDILPLAVHMLQCLSGRQTVGWRIEPQAQSLLLAYPWPGNVRELENVMQRAAVLSGDGRIGAEHLMFDTPLEAAASLAAAPATGAPAVTTPAAAPALPMATAPALAAPVDWSPTPVMAMGSGGLVADGMSAEARLQDAVRHNEHQLILAAIDATSSRIEAARKLGISPRTLRYKLAKLKTQPLAMSGT
ncbi:MAG: sigma-54 interaction domain-containing protein [Limnohabitans sp.]